MVREWNELRLLQIIGGFSALMVALGCFAWASSGVRAGDVVEFIKGGGGAVFTAWLAKKGMIG